MAKNRHLEQTAEDNLIDMLVHCFKPDGLSRDEIVQICTECLVVADYTWGLLRIAEVFVDVLSDKASAIEIYNKAEALIMDTADYCLLASSISSKLQDFEWSNKLLEQAIANTKKNPNPYDYTNIAEKYLEIKDRTSNARDFYNQAEELAVSSEDVQSLADSIFRNLKDMEWGVKLLNKIEFQLNDNPNFHDYWILAELYWEYTDEKQKSKKFFEQAEKYATSMDEFGKLTYSVNKNLHDAVWYEKLKIKAGLA
jgi:tetratricopeptide (TPR) repeat protein